MSDHLHFWLQRKMQSFEQDCRQQTLLLTRKETMRDVRLATNVHASSEVKHMPEVRQAESKLKRAAENRMSEILTKHLETLAEIDDLEVFKEQRGKYMHHDWCHLRGDFPRLYVEADRSSMQLFHKLQLKLETPSNPDSPSI